jgi:N-acetylglucosaminyldiphosphoundecaprenol N-acetyl-beta-D-mannosaminyltransferase
MSTPRQAHGILDNLEQIPAHIILPSGAAIDYIAGAVPTPPRWSGNLGLEWRFRLIAEPKRLWQRYLIEPWFLLQWFLKHSL